MDRFRVLSAVLIICCQLDLINGNCSNFFVQRLIEAAVASFVAADYRDLSFDFDDPVLIRVERSDYSIGGPLAKTGKPQNVQGEGAAPAPPATTAAGPAAPAPTEAPAGAPAAAPAATEAPGGYGSSPNPAPHPPAISPPTGAKPGGKGGGYHICENCVIT